MKLKRLISIILAIAMTTTALCGCSDGNTGGEKDKGTVAKPAKGESLLTALKFEPDENMDLSGKELKVGLWGSVPKRGASDITDRRYLLADKVQEKYGVTVNFVALNSNSFEKEMALAYSSGQNLADLFFAPHGNAYGVCRIGAALALDDYIDYSSPFYTRCGELSRYVDGKHYSYMPDFWNVNDMGLFVLCNQALIEAAGCEDPLTLYEAGKWNWAAFEEIVRKCTTINNGEVTQYGVGNTHLLDAIMMSNGVTSIGIDYKNNKYTCGFFDEAGYNALNFVKKLISDYGSYDKSYGSNNSALLFTQSKMAMMISANYNSTSSVSKGMPIVIVPLPLGNDVEDESQIIGKEIQEWWLCSSISKFTNEQLVQLALELNLNIPEYEDTYIEDEQQFFVDLLYEQSIVTTEEEAIMFYDLNNSKDTTIMVETNLTDFTEIKGKIFKMLAEGSDARTAIDTYKPNINSLLESLVSK